MKSLQPEPPAGTERLHALDAVRAFALLLGVVFHASLSFMPITIGWAVMDLSTSPVVSAFVVVSHSFRMELFFLIGGFFAHLSFHRQGAGRFLRSRAVRLGVPFVVGWFVLWPLIVSAWVMGAASMRGEVDIAAGLVEGFKTFEALPEGLFVRTHLWFLYYLGLITVVALGLRALLGLLPGVFEKVAQRADQLLRGVAQRPFGLLALVLPTIGLLWLMRGWGMDTPDQSLLPHWPVLGIYGGFFALGWMLHRNREQLAPLTRLSWRRGVEVSGAIAGALHFAAVQGDPGHPWHAEYRLAFTISYAIMMWLLVLLTIGLFRKIFDRSRPWVRYVADSSYWMYLIHLPVVAWLQVTVAEWPLHWTLKLAFISLVTVGLALLTYDLIVRSTWIGWILNGHRRPRLLQKRKVAPSLTLASVRVKSQRSSITSAP